MRNISLQRANPAELGSGPAAAKVGQLPPCQIPIGEALELSPARRGFLLQNVKHGIAPLVVVFNRARVKDPQLSLASQRSIFLMAKE